MNIETNAANITQPESNIAAKAGKTKTAQKSFSEEMQDLSSIAGTEDETCESVSGEQERHSSMPGQEEDYSYISDYQKMKDPSQDTLYQTVQTDDILSAELNNTTEDAVNNLISAANLTANLSEADTIVEQKETNQVLNNDINIYKSQEDALQELKTDISFTQDEAGAFSSLLSNNNSLQENADELSEDNNILSTAAENLAMINKAIAAKHNENALNAVGEVVDTTISASVMNLTMNDVQVFMNMLSGIDQNISDLTSSDNLRGGAVSETLANMLAESMKNNQAFRINFDNSISVIIKVSREGKISANFLPATDAAENYLKNNISSLIKTFEDENLPYDDISHQKQKRDSSEQSKKEKNSDE